VGLIVIDEDPADALRVAQAADRAGVHSLWSIDYYNRSSLARAAAFAAVTSNALVGTSIAPLFARAPLAMAAAVSDIQSLAHGRFVLGVGTSTRRMNADWYGIPLEHPAQQAAERIDAIRAVLAHKSGPFSFQGRFDRLSLAHLDRAAAPAPPPILAAGVGERMVTLAGQSADGFVGHPIASAEYLRDRAWPLLRDGMARAGRADADFCVTTQVVAAVDEKPEAARRSAAAQVGFYATVKGYDPLFPGGSFAAERLAARQAFAQGDVTSVAAAAWPMVKERAVYGTAADVSAQLARYRDVVDWALLYPPHYGVEAADITANELALIEVAACWTS
jgi:alkanesulfonate monooxygenase SsuD/methylene tetrahydromethanopterin reductase-like flavin-dependent oxidoreductase (luciferase family)